MEHDLFKPRSFEEARHSVVGDCNGIPMDERWKVETPIFAREILIQARGGKELLGHIGKSCMPGTVILDYGCGCGRLAKEVLSQDPNVTVIGLDASKDELKLAKEYVNDSRFTPVLPHELNQNVDLVYCVYCLQHAPAIEIREILQRIRYFLKDDGVFIYCSSDYRMAIRFDGGGFFDDRFLGVNIREEISRFFQEKGDLFPQNGDLNPVIRKMIYGDLPHPAKVFVKKSISGPIFNSQFTQDQRSSVPGSESKPKRKLILRNRLSPGDILVMTTAIRALVKSHGDKFEVDVDSPCHEIFENNPYLTKLNGNGQIIDMQYPEIHKSGVSGRHFSDGHRKYLEEVLDIKIPRVGLLPDLFLSQDEILWPSPVLKDTGYDGKYWVINAGSKSDYTLKQYHRWQDVLDLWAKKYPGIKFVQVGQLEHNHRPLEGAIDMRGRTNIRQLIRTIYKAEGVLSCVSFPMHIAAALEKPCVVVAGAREGTRWELYPSHRFLYINGAIDCALYDGCWRSKLEDCKHPVNTDLDMGRVQVPLCLEMIRPEDVARAMELYYLGGILKADEVVHV